MIGGFLDIYKESTWQLIICRGLKIKSLSAQNFFIQQAYDHTGHGGLNKTYQNLTDKYNWKDSYSDVKEFVESCEHCQSTKSSTQKPVGLLTPLTVPQRPWIEIAMDFFFLKQLVVNCTKLIPGMKFSDKQKPHFVTFCKVLNIIDRHCNYTYIICCIGENNAARVIDIFEKHIKPPIGLPFAIISDQDILFVSAAFQDWIIKNDIRHTVSTTHYPETDGQTEKKNRELTEMFAAHELQGTDWLTAALKVQT